MSGTYHHKRLNDNWKMNPDRVHLDAYFDLEFGVALNVAPRSETVEPEPAMGIITIDDSWKKVQRLETMTPDEYADFKTQFHTTDGTNNVYKEIRRKCRAVWSCRESRTQPKRRRKN